MSLPAKSFYVFLQAAQHHYGLQDTFTARVQMETGLVHYVSGDFDGALKEYQAALAAFRVAEGVLATDTQECFFRTGVVLRELGDFYRAQDFIEASLAAPNADARRSARHHGKCHNALGNIALRLQNFAAARGHYLEAMAALKPLIGENSPMIGAMSLNLGVAYLQQDSIAQAIGAQQRALEIFEERLPPSHPMIGSCYLNLGEIYLQAGDLQQAQSYILAASAFWEAHLDAGHVNHAIAAYDLGDVQLKTDSGFAALALYQQALERIAPGFDGQDWRDDPAMEAVQSEVELLEIWTRKAAAIALCREQDPAQFQVEDAFAIYRKIGLLLDRMRLGYRRESSQQFLIGKTLPVFEAAISLAYVTESPEAMQEAFSYAERSKAVSLYAALKGAQAYRFAGVPKQLLQREARQKEALVALNQQLDKLTGAENEEQQHEYRSLVQERFALEQAYEALIDTFAREFPHYFQHKYAHDVISLADVQQQLAEQQKGKASDAGETAMIVYFQGDEDVYAWAITASQTQFQRLGPRSEVNRLCDSLLSRINGRRTFETESQSAYKVLLAPLLEALDTSGLDRLLIVRDGKLAYLPFALLQTEKNRYLVEQFAISYTPSATICFAERPARTPTENYLGMAQTFPGGYTPTEALRAQSLAALPNTANEIAAGQDIFGGSNWLDAQATEKRFREISDRFAVLHLATHTLIDDRNPLYSRLVFQADGAQETDGLLHTYELFGMDLNADLVVLSACNTGKGRVQKGEGMMSLSRGFAYAGCPSVLMTHWTVSDRQSAVLMESFFRYLDAGLPKDYALQQAQIEYLAQADEITAHPWFWAAPGILGDVSPLDLPAQKGISWWIWTLVFLLAGTGVFFFLRRRRR